MKVLWSLLLVACMGCTSVSYGPLTVRSIGTDVQIEDGQWVKMDANGKPSEIIVVKGCNRNSSTSTHVVANSALAIAGAIMGSPAGAPGAAAGAVAAGGIGELYQSLKDYLSQTNVATPAVIVKPAIPITGDLVDPPNPPYNQAFMDANGRDEEVGLEEHDGIISRYCVIRGQSGGYWMIASLGRGHVTRASDHNVGIASDFEQDGYAYHVKGYTANEPDQDKIFTMPLSQVPDKYVVIECRKMK